MATPIYTNSDLCKHFSVTSFMLATVDRLIDHATGEVYYTVKSEHTNERYEVRYNREHKTFTCTCKAGQHGFVRCKSFCKHVRAAKAFALQRQQRLDAQARYEALESTQARRKAFAEQMHELEQERDEARKTGGFSLLK